MNHECRGFNQHGLAKEFNPFWIERLWWTSSNVLVRCETSEGCRRDWIFRILWASNQNKKRCEEPRNIKPVKPKAFARPDGPPEKDPVFVQRGDSLLILSGQLKVLLCRRTFVWLQWEVSFKLTTLHWSFSAFFFKFGPLFLRLSKELRSLWPFFQLFRENSFRQGVSWIMFRSDVAELLRVYCLLDFSNCDRKLASLFSQSINFFPNIFIDNHIE